MTPQHRFYLLLASLIFSAGITNSYAGTNLGTLNEVGMSTKYCSSGFGDDSPCLFCAPSNVSFNKVTYCIDNACQASNYKRASSGDYGYAIAAYGYNHESGYFVCDTSQGWVYSATDPSSNPSDPYTCGSENCVSSDWAALRTGYQSRTYRYCSNNACQATTQYRCAKNYYGSSTNGTSGCTKCPNSTDYIATESNKKWVSTGEKSPGYTSDAGNTTAVRACYIPRLGGSEMYLDSTGAYDFTSNCYWS